MKAKLAVLALLTDEPGAAGGGGLSNQDKQHQTAVPGTARQRQRHCKTPWPLPAGKVGEQEQVPAAALRLTRLSDLGTGTCGTTLRQGGRPGKSRPPPRRTDAVTRQDVFLGEGTAAPSCDHRSLPANSSAVETRQGLAWLCELLPVFPHHCFDVNPRLGGEEALLPYLLCRPQKVPEQLLGTSSPFFYAYYYPQQQKHQHPVTDRLLWETHYARRWT